MKLVVFGLSLSSSWGNGHATTYRAILRAFSARGHQVVFYEWDAPWYGGDNRDLPAPEFAELILYPSWEDVRERAVREALAADAVLVGSYVHEACELIDDLAAAGVDPLYYYDIDTPVTVAALRRGGAEYLRPDQVPLFTRYLSFTGGPFLHDVLERELGARRASALFCSVDPDAYQEVERDPELEVDLAYMGTYAADRQPVIERFLIEVAKRLPEKRFIVAGPQYPEELEWPSNVRLIPHLPPARHSSFYTSAKWQLNATRADMVAAGWSPSVRLFEAGAVGAAIISDRWPGIDELFDPGREILLPDSTEDVVRILSETSDQERREIGSRMRERILSKHTADARARELEDYFLADRVFTSAVGGATQ